MKTTIEIPDDLFRQAKATALSRGMTLKQLITGAVEHELGQTMDKGDQESARQRAMRFVTEIGRLAQDNAADWKSTKSAMQQLFEDRSARNY